VTDLLPCPFCGSEAIFQECTDPDDEANFGGWYIDCTGCIATSDLRFASKEDPRPLLAEAWNRRVLPPGSDPSPAPCLDAKEMMRDVFTSWLKHRAAILTSPAEPAARHSTGAMELARLVLSKWRNAEGVGFHYLPWETLTAAVATTITSAEQGARAKALIQFSKQQAEDDKLVDAQITSAVEQERQACAEIAKTHCWMPGAGRYDYRITRAIRSRSAEPPNTKGGE
jgi:hypothetical protein